MATRSTIARLTANGVESIYCHWDGYPAHVGRTLNDHYTDEAKIARLLSLGDLSSLADEIGEQNDFDNPDRNICLFYGRDRGEDGVESQMHTTVDHWLSNRAGSGCEYGYLWNGITWEVFGREYGKGWREHRADERTPE